MSRFDGRLTSTVRLTTYKEATLNFSSIDTLQSAMREKHYIAERGLATSLYLARLPAPSSAQELLVKRRRGRRLERTNKLRG